MNTNYGYEFVRVLTVTRGESRSKVTIVTRHCCDPGGACGVARVTRDVENGSVDHRCAYVVIRVVYGTHGAVR